MVGVSKLANTHSASSVTSGLIIGGIGTIFLLRNLGYIYGNIWEYFWPGILIAVGLSILAKHLEGRGQDWSPGLRRPEPHRRDQANPFRRFRIHRLKLAEQCLHIENVFSGTQQRIESQDFEGGKIAVVFGGAEIDLRNAVTKREEISIKAEAIFGGIELWVPSNWQTIVRGSAVFGASKIKRSRRLRERPAKHPAWWLLALRFLAA